MEMPTGLNITRMSTADQAAAVLREKILRGELPPATPLKEQSLADSFDISRNTMREAIRLLVYEGLVQHVPHRGATVTSLSSDDVSDIYTARRVLEIAAARAAEEAPADELSRLEELIDRMERAIADEEWVAVVECDMRFHRTLVSLLGSRRLDEFYRTLLAELRLALVLVDSSSDDTAQLIHEHRRLYDLLDRGEGGELAEALRTHLAAAERQVREAVAVDGES